MRCGNGPAETARHCVPTLKRSKSLLQQRNRETTQSCTSFGSHILYTTSSLSCKAHQCSNKAAKKSDAQTPSVPHILFVLHPNHQINHVYCSNKADHENTELRTSSDSSRCIISVNTKNPPGFKILDASLTQRCLSLPACRIESCETTIKQMSCCDAGKCSMLIP